MRSPLALALRGKQLPELDELHYVNDESLDGSGSGTYTVLDADTDIASSRSLAGELGRHDGRGTP